MTITNSATKGREIWRSVQAVDDEEVIATGGSFDEWNRRLVHIIGAAHSVCTGPKAVTASNFPHSRKHRSTATCWRRVPSHSKRTRTCRGVGATCTFDEKK